MKTTPKKFTAYELQQIDEADDLKISPFREDGLTYGMPTWIWEVVVEDELYVRAYNGTSSRWFQPALKQKAGRIHAASIVKEVTFIPVLDNDTNLHIDAAYRKKYQESPYLPPMIGSRAKSATIRIIPQ